MNVVTDCFYAIRFTFYEIKGGVPLNIQWFPGHMKKTERMIEENLKFIDVVLELVDARIPVSGRNPDILRLCAGKKVLTLFNKADLADQNKNKLWQEKFGEDALFINAVSGTGMKEIAPRIREMMKEKTERDLARGIKERSVKLMIVGVPNVGKSSFINRFSKKAVTEVADRPGVTRSKQWVRLTEGFELLDTPGVLWPKFSDEEAARRLAYTGAIKDDVIDTEELCHYFLEFMRDHYPENLASRYKIDNISGLAGYEITEMIGRKRGFVISGGEINTERAANVVLDEFRGGLLGRVTFDDPEELL